MKQTDKHLLIEKATSHRCAQAQTLLARGAAVDTALQRTIYGVGGVQSPFVPLASSPAGRQIDTTVVQALLSFGKSRASVILISNCGRSPRTMGQ